MIPQLISRLTGEWQLHLHSTGLRLAPPLKVVQKSSGPGPARKIVFLVFSAASSKPAVALKATRDPAYNEQITEEYSLLNALWQRPALQPVIPQPIGLFEQGEHLILAEKILPGTPLNLLLRRQRRHRRRLPGLATCYLSTATVWLGRFQDSGPRTSSTVPGRETIAARLDRLPSGRLQPAFVAKLEEQARRYRDLTLPLVNAHGDFWPGNLLWEGKGGLQGVYDWEAFHPGRPPFYDLFLFITTFALECAWMGRNRAARFHAGFLADTWLSRLLAGAVAALFNRYGLPPAAASFLYSLFLLERATPGASARVKEREQAGSWRALLQQYAGAPRASRMFAGEWAP